MEGLETPALVPVVALGPAALIPAQTVQLSHPGILWIWDFTVWADERIDAAESANKEITRTHRGLVVFFNITTFLLQGVFIRPRILLRRIGD
jgi:NhaP-type Na+/H+ and K+/H+ antiporter